MESRESFSQQLNKLSLVSLPSLKNLNIIAAEGTNVTDNESEPLQETLTVVDSTVARILRYFKTALSVLVGLDSQDDVEWMYEGRQAVLQIGASVLRAADVMADLMTILEATKSKNTDTASTQDYLPIVEKIEQSIGEWHEILGLIRNLRVQVDIATEWKDIHDQVLGDVQQEIDQCFDSIFEIEEQRHFPAKSRIDIDALNSIMDESPFLGYSKLPNLSDLERSVNHKFIELSTRSKPLRASLDFIPIRLDQYISKASQVFPSSIAALKQKYKELESKWTLLQQDIATLEKELGEDRWSVIFRKTGAQASEMLDTFEENLDRLETEKQKHKLHGYAFDHQRIDRYLARNSYLGPAITRILSLFDRALDDRLTVNGEMYSVQSNLHKRWEELSTRGKQLDLTLSPDLANSPLSRFDDSADLLSSNRSSNGSSIGSLSSPLSSIDNSPTTSHSGLYGKLKRVQFPIKPRLSTTKLYSDDMNDATPQPQSRASSRLSLLPLPLASPRPMYIVDEEHQTRREVNSRQSFGGTRNFSQPVYRSPSRQSESSQIPVLHSPSISFTTPKRNMTGRHSLATTTPRPRRPSSRIDENDTRLSRPSSRLDPITTSFTPALHKRSLSPRKSSSQLNSVHKMPSLATMRNIDTPSKDRERPNTSMGLRASLIPRPPWR